MKTDYYHINFVRAGSENKKAVYGCYNKKNSNFFGLVQWYPPTKEYCFYIEGKNAISGECLKELSEFVIQLNKQ